MALQVWLPLNGNLNNQGLSNISITSSNISYSTGKITSKSKSTGTVNLSTEFIDKIKVNHKVTIAFWIKPTGTAGTAEFMGNSSNRELCNLFQFPSYDDLHLSYLLTDNSTSFSGYILNDAFSDNQWHHITIVNDTGLINVYNNGVLSATWGAKGTWTRTIFSTFQLKNNNLNYLNDVRIYDHCLSQKEIKELSKGLCLHYKLSRGGENLLKNSGKYQTYTYTNNAKDGYLSLPIYVNGVSTSKQYTLSCETDGTLFQHSTGGNPPNNKYWTIWLYQHSTPFTDSDYARYNTPTCFTNSNYNHTQVGNKHYWVFTPSYANLSIRLNLYSDGVNNETVTFKNIKLEEGNVCTSWLPNKSDTLYSQLGYNNIEPDCSGYGNDGTISGTLTYSNDTPRYEGSSYLTDSESCIKIGDLSKISPSGIFTFNIWFKKLTGIWSSKTWETILGGPSGFEIESKLGSTTNNYIHPYNWGGGSVSTPNSYSIPYNLDTWNMLTMVRTASDTKFYLNGELKVTGTAGTIPSGDYFLGAWRDSVSQNYRGILSDARIYATALSAEDVKALYNTPISIDNHKNLHCMELEQTNNQTSFCKSGVAKMELLPIPTITEKCAGNTYTKQLKIWANGSQLKLNDVHKIRIIFRSRGDGTPTSSKCSSIGCIMYENSWKWSVNPIWWSSATAYNNIGKIIDYTGSLTVNSTMTSTTTNIPILLFWIIQNGWANGNDNQTHDLYYYKYWNATTGEVYAESGTPEYDRITTNDFMEV